MTIKMPRNLMTAISVVAFAVMLHGCGGGGGSSPVTTAPPDDTTHSGWADDRGRDRSVRDDDRHCRQTMTFQTSQSVPLRVKRLLSQVLAPLRVSAPMAARLLWRVTY